MEKAELIAIIQKSKDGDMEAMEKLLLYAHTSVSYQCRKMLKNEQDVEDMTQEILVTVYQKLDALKEPAAFNQWIKKITATRCVNALTRTHVELQFAEDEEGNSILNTLEEMDEKKIPDKWLDNKETTRMIEEIVNGLPDVQRLCTLMFYYSEMSVKEIAYALKVSENTIKSRLNYARKAIKERVLDYEKKGVKLYGLSPLPFLFYFLHKREDEEKDPVAAQIMVDEILAQSAFAVAGIVNVATSAATSTTTTAVAGTAAAAGSAATTGASSAGIAAVLGTIPPKIIAGVAAALVFVGGTTAAVTLGNIAKKEETAPTVFVEEQDGSSWDDDIIFEEAEPTTETEAAEAEKTISGTEETIPEETNPSDAGSNNTPTGEEYNSTETDPTVHTHQYSVNFTQTASCTKQGYTEYICSVCGETYVGNYVEKLSHNYKATVTAPDCENGGYTDHTCEACGDTYRDTETEALGHNYTETVIAANCVNAGYTEHTCGNCGNTYRDAETEALGHDYASTVVAPTYTEQGYTEYVCGRCGDTYKDNYTDTLSHLLPSGSAINALIADDTTSVVFTNTVAADAETTDISETQDGSIVYWYDGTTMYISSSDGNSLGAAKNCSGMFSGKSEITSIDLTNFDTSQIVRMDNMFQGCSNLTSLDISNFDTSNVTSMKGMFQGCANLTSLDVSNFDTSNVTNMEMMFATCRNLTSLDVSCFNTSNVTNMSSMFAACHHLTNLNLSNIDTSSVTNMNGMFSSCLYLPSLDVSNFDTSNVTDMTGMFSACTTLTNLDLSNFDISNVTRMGEMFYASSALVTIYAGDWTNTATNVIVDGYMFQSCRSLVGAVAYNGTDDLSMANPTTGYFTSPGNTASVFSLDREEHIHTYDGILTDATCTDGSYTTYTCSCGDTYVAEETDPTGHQYQSAVVEPTETEQGYTKYVCDLCGDTYRDCYTDPSGDAEAPSEEPSEKPTEEPSAEPSEELHSHSYTGTVTAATCASGGYTTYLCSCGDTYAADETDPAGHQYQSAVVEPTETEQGYTEYFCSVCGDTYRADHTVPLPTE